MGRRSHTQTLYLWMNGAFVGTWRVRPHVGEILQYDDNWVNASQGRPLSLSLPFTPGNQPHRGDAVRAYFENLLPDSKAIRERVARRFQTSSTEAFALLAEIGRDCVGALQVLPNSAPPESVQEVTATPLNDAEVAQILRNTLAPASKINRDNDDVDFRISIAGAQEKTALSWLNNQWCLPHGATPTTHILKLPLGLVGNLKFDMNDSIENEWLCSKILHAYGVPVASTQILQFEDMKVLAVERFDRMWWENEEGKRWLLRLPQEDMCQATGTPPHLKYESDGGPGVRTIMKLLATSRDPDRDRRTFFQAQVLFWMLRATDGHAKNFSIFLRPGGTYELTPLYDVLSAYPVIGRGANQLSPFKAKMAMAVRSKNTHWVMRDIVRRHWLAVGKEHGIVAPDGRGAEVVLGDMVEKTPEVVRSVRAMLPEKFPEHVANSILSGLQGAADKLAG
ncbi:type II toxin-antitoxin system HipA family toxin [Pusillimonas sp. DMV24BSW_D]|uniref:type II toxin-antitoxin system HipA family toxin n=1 Tax=Neopusillimonas aestuarii TaxID=2716226 RepID=UPI00140D07AD|nr:type II toxin-antitoxin system HipA family toxin [Pusillimonas sp. DMV24BSW_D]QIM48349.1 type II toxin-antitoxin system HipA family toxin [Pusillimonas sp. DMV24BSW_D]